MEIGSSLRRSSSAKDRAPVAGRAVMNLHASGFDPLTELEPEVLSAQFMVSDVYGGGFAVEDRRLLKRLIP